MENTKGKMDYTDEKVRPEDTILWFDREKLDAILTRLRDKGLIEWTPGKDPELSSAAIIAWYETMHMTMIWPTFPSYLRTLKEDRKLPVDYKLHLLYQLFVVNILTGELTTDFPIIEDEIKEEVAVLVRIFKVTGRLSYLKPLLYPTSIVAG